MSDKDNVASGKYDVGWVGLGDQGAPSCRDSSTAADPGFLHALGHHRLGWADLRRNVQSIAAVRVAGGYRVELFIVNHSSRCSLKISGSGCVAFIEDEPDLVAKLAGEAYESLVDCAVAVSVDFHDWNCVRDTPAGSTVAEVAATRDTLNHRLTALQADNAQLRTLLDRRPGGSVAPYGNARGTRMPCDRGADDAVPASSDQRYRPAEWVATSYGRCTVASQP